MEEHVYSVVGYLRSKRIHTEPIIFLISACNAAVGVVTPTLSQEKMNRTYVPPEGVDPKTFINKWMVHWDQQYDYVNIPIACFMGIMYGGLSDRYGRKLPMLIGLMSVFTSTALKMAVYSPLTNWPLEVFYPMAVICGVFGDFSLTMTSVNSYMTDQFPDKKRLSFRMVIVSIVFSLGSFSGAQMTRLLIKWTDLIAVMAIALGGTVLAFFYGVIVLDWIIPQKAEAVEVPAEEGNADPEEQQRAIEPENEAVVESQEEDERKPSFWTVIKVSFRSIYDSFKVFAVKREGHKRFFLYVCFLANFLDQFVFGEEKSLIGTYTKLPPFEWKTADFAVYKSWRPIVQIIGMSIGLSLLKKVLKLRDTICICLAIASMGSCCLLIGLARESWQIYASLVPEAFHGLLNPLTFTFISCMVAPTEIGKAYAISSIAQQFAGICETAILQNIYKATVDWYQGFVWLVMSGISLVAFILYGMIHVIAVRENVGS